MASAFQPILDLGAAEGILTQGSPTCFSISAAPCGPDFNGALLLPLKGPRLAPTIAPTNNPRDQFPIPTTFANEADFVDQMDQFVNDAVYFNGSSTTTPRRYQASLFCISAVFAGFQGGCYENDTPLIPGNGTAIFKGPIIGCLETCYTAIDTLTSSSSEAFPGVSIFTKTGAYLAQFRSLCSSMYAGAYSPYYPMAAPRNCLMAINGSTTLANGNELLTCGFSGPNAQFLKYTYCKSYKTQWCCSQTDIIQGGNLTGTVAVWDNTNKFYKVAADSTRNDSLVANLVFPFLCIIVFLLISFTIHVINWVGRRRQNAFSEFSEKEFTASRTPKSSRKFTDSRGGVPANYNQFFHIMGLKTPEEGGVPADVDRFFYAGKIGWKADTDGTFHGTPAVNPYAPPTDSENRPPLLELDKLSQVSFSNKLKMMGNSIPFFSSPRLKKRYKLGNTLITHQRSMRHEYSQMRIYNKFRTVPRLVLGSAVSVLMLVMGGIFVWGLAVSKEQSLTLDKLPVWILKTASVAGRVSQTISAYGTSLAVAILLLVIYLSSYTPLPEPGLLKYLRQVGTPKIEEVMISYSWEPVISENARGLARCLMESGIGAWIDVMKLEASDDTAKITRTVASHTRFVIIFLTDKYLTSSACFIEFLEALNSPNAKDRVIVWVPAGNKASERVNNVCQQLERFEIPVIKDFGNFITYLNDAVIHSNQDSHLYWWQHYVGITAGIPFDAIAPSPKQAPHLRRYNFNLLGAPRHSVKISNIWVAPSLRKTGTAASSLPLGGNYIGLLNVFIFALMLCVNLNDMLSVLSLLNLQSTNVDFGMPTVASPPDFLIAWINIGLEWFVMILLVFVSSLSGEFDNRYQMHPNLRPLMASFNIRQRKQAEKKSWFSWSKGEPTLSQTILQKQTGVNALPKVKVLVYAFGAKNQVAETLHQFLKNLDLVPTDAFDFANDDFGKRRDGFEVFVPVFVFGGSKEDLQRQVIRFGQIVERCNLKMQDCVLIAADPVKNVELKGLFQSKFVFEGKQVALSQFLVLVENYYKGNEFASEVVFHIGLRVKEALMRISHETTKDVELLQEGWAPKNYGSYVAVRMNQEE
ncbi:hypothetical protein HDU98_000518 [Podochytrium sp. JEL0797]|nr:hypothetical protein HDU98_000518 [Podochytrium sp. JEL0797]